MEKMPMTTAKYKGKLNKNYFEYRAWAERQVVCGLDEVGRGCLAGPVVTAAVILFPQKNSPLIKDSKILNQSQRIKAYRWIVKNSWFSYGIIDNKDIDIFNIYHATLHAMKRTLMQLFINSPTLPQKILVDAMPLNLSGTAYENIDVIYFPKGERKSTSIAAASIVAKVKRDEIMRRLNILFPLYHFDKHKGYATKLHRQSVKIHGQSILHRLRFLQDKAWLCDQQLSLPFDYEEMKYVLK